MNQVLQRIEKVAHELSTGTSSRCKGDPQELSPTLLMWEFCNQTMDDELTAWGSDIVDVAEKIEYYMVKNGTITEKEVAQ
ncbi:hypothetical protein [Paenibacillus sp. OV219]|uniref:hypothetical protein n=1 Tax=Paenibacillus sp. OV219 TaxID=1884377 RepID=UPI0008B8F7BC|nr:hypothetical protein [Paenibacillus sp. OV219]SEN21306.1 hypothetical protein SAMN05518847_102427 [Paenibacillus sp. OV219]